MAARIYLPQFGRIHGGQLAGWYFHFLRYLARPAEVLLLARVTRPNWPFPRDMALDASHYDRFMPGEGSAFVDADQLILSAYRAEGLTVPKYLTDSSTRLQELIKAWSKKPRKQP